MKPTNTEPVRGLENNARSDAAALRPAPTFAGLGLQRFSADCLQALAELKERVAAELAIEFTTLNRRLIRQVVNEADSLASTTPFPGLLFPALAEEKVRNAWAWATRQRTIRAQTLAFVA